MPSGEGKIVNWDEKYCKKCRRYFGSKGALYSHLIHSKFHRKDLLLKEQEELRKYKLITEFF